MVGQSSLEITPAAFEELPGTLDFEGVEVCAFAFGEGVLDDFVDAATAGAALKRGAELGEAFYIAGGYDFDIAVFGVTHPTLELEFAGLAMDEPAEAYALDSASN
jgi:hypothetical protein